MKKHVLALAAGGLALAILPGAAMAYESAPVTPHSLADDQSFHQKSDRGDIFQSLDITQATVATHPAAKRYVAYELRHLAPVLPDLTSEY